MQSPLFAFNEQQTQDRWSLQNQQMLRVGLEGHDDVLARKGSMVAYQGRVEFDAEFQSSGASRARAHTGEGLDLMRCHGQGTVYLANLRGYHKTAELAANPRVELCYLDDRHDQVRITGTAESYRRRGQEYRRYIK